MVQAEQFGVAYNQLKYYVNSGQIPAKKGKGGSFFIDVEANKILISLIVARIKNKGTKSEPKQIAQKKYLDSLCNREPKQKKAEEYINFTYRDEIMQGKIIGGTNDAAMFRLRNGNIIPSVLFANIKNYVDSDIILNYPEISQIIWNIKKSIVK